MPSRLIEEARAGRQLPAAQEARRIRLAAGLTQRQIADELGVSTLTVIRWESGQQRPQQRHRVPYARLLMGLQKDLER